MAAVVDALPYYDTEPTDEERDAVDALIEAELPKKQPLHPSLQATKEWQPRSKLIQQELVRAASGERLAAIDLTRYQDLQLSEETTDLPALMRRNVIAVEAMKTRLDNLSLLKQFGANAWIYHVFKLEQQLKGLERALQATQQETEQLNAQRKREQIKAGERIGDLTEKWRATVSGNLELSVACAMLEAEIEVAETA
ncbi:Pre-mRNA-splicing factor SPF27 [Protomyces lactucae-debilis]|uniref:Pre-mRNA-splicing factor SPF27 n=1 Tax=Protomyces lactucae-debilis TaxID=2754530 RepID=A0A1Y2EZK5_PROLT|nr:Pre-mRNA-splicing factor SPF27 [Protomyces lactucae-debilis]ORY77038.1 Pre-mRNA-splicing factor SPF27 [Protomyces lactucae-debilis]